MRVYLSICVMLDAVQKTYDDVPFNPRTGNCCLQSSAGKEVDWSLILCMSWDPTHTHIMDSGATKQTGRTSPADGQARCALDCEQGLVLQSWTLNKHMFEAPTQVRCVEAVQIYLDHVCAYKEQHGCINGRIHGSTDKRMVEWVDNGK